MKKLISAFALLVFTVFALSSSEVEANKKTAQKTKRKPAASAKSDLYSYKNFTSVSVAQRVRLIKAAQDVLIQAEKRRPSVAVMNLPSLQFGISSASANDATTRYFGRDGQQVACPDGGKAQCVVGGNLGCWTGQRCLVPESALCKDKDGNNVTGFSCGGAFTLNEKGSACAEGKRVNSGATREVMNGFAEHCKEKFGAVTPARVSGLSEADYNQSVRPVLDMANGSCSASGTRQAWLTEANCETWKTVSEEYNNSRPTIMGGGGFETPASDRVRADAAKPEGTAANSASTPAAVSTVPAVASTGPQPSVAAGPATGPAEPAPKRVEGAEDKDCDKKFHKFEGSDLEVKCVKSCNGQKLFMFKKNSDNKNRSRSSDETVPNPPVDEVYLVSFSDEELKNAKGGSKTDREQLKKLKKISPIRCEFKDDPRSQRAFTHFESVADTMECEDGQINLPLSEYAANSDRKLKNSGKTQFEVPEKAGRLKKRDPYRYECKSEDGKPKKMRQFVRYNKNTGKNNDTYEYVIERGGFGSTVDFQFDMKCQAQVNGEIAGAKQSPGEMITQFANNLSSEGRKCLDAIEKGSSTSPRLNDGSSGGSSGTAESGDDE